MAVILLVFALFFKRRGKPQSKDYPKFKFFIKFSANFLNATPKMPIYLFKFTLKRI